MAKISKSELLGKVLQALAAGDWTPVVVDDMHPFLIRAVAANGASLSLRVYIWNCTHGGGGRNANEFRIQVTSMVPRLRDGEITALLGWHDELQVFAAWDINAHVGQDSESPSCQVRLDTLEATHEGSFAIQVKDNETVVAFQPYLISDYALSSASLHAGGAAARDMSLLNRLPTLDDDEIEEVVNVGRRTLIRTITTKYRAYWFRRRVLRAYRHQCAFCSVQLGLVDAAHIVPVSSEESTDEVPNGVALCKLHHFAYDTNLISFDERYVIRTSRQRAAELTQARLMGGWNLFRDALRVEIVVPRDERLRPSPQNISAARRIRGWRD